MTSASSRSSSGVNPHGAGPHGGTPAAQDVPDPVDTDDPPSPDADELQSWPAGAEEPGQLVIVANRLPVDQIREADGSVGWRPSPGGLVAALKPVLEQRDGLWIGWTGVAGPAPGVLHAEGLTLVPVPLSDTEVELYYEGMSNGTLWPLYHDVIVPPGYHRQWWDVYVRVNWRFAEAVARTAEAGATVWVQDYQLQLVPAMLRGRRPDLRIGFFNHIPFPPYEIFAQLPWRRQVLNGLLGADLIGFQRPADANNFLRACRRNGIPTVGRTVCLTDAGPRGTADAERAVRVGVFPVSTDAESFDTLARSPEVQERARQIRRDLGDPDLVMLGVDRLDYTKGILHRLQAFGELLDDGKLSVPGTVLVQVATPSRERVDQYQNMRHQVEVAVGRINGTHGKLGQPAVHYLHQSWGKKELTALYLAADVMLVTPLRDGMNLVAKEYVATRFDNGGTLVLSEFAGAAIELTQAHIVNPHDVEGMKQTMLEAVAEPRREAARRMRAMRRRVFKNDVRHWAGSFLRTLGNRERLSERTVDRPVVDPQTAPLQLWRARPGRRNDAPAGR